MSGMNPPGRGRTENDGSKLIKPQYTYSTGSFRTDQCTGAAKCTRVAVYDVRIHKLDHCNTQGLDVQGDQTFALCPECVRSFVGRIKVELDELEDETMCKTCGRVVYFLHDLVTVEFLEVR